ncbi:DUF3305 domain-containing protein [Qingshengfaniella alkalisoli]|uniref:DUF3305 domain-containing protein n=1 Tax=Qingshengfaniella alkalisoli TaxID=2599296 RepID=A0A5B8IYW4_9RHOB|nr:DUF3305 domain-containing protein [Qingshengfaniella alkalisoli]QDY69798.1 DUF3305 domain-containing protein [Qingshengfaniella alkalisoli]
MPSIEQRETSLPVGVIVEKRRSNHPWMDWGWKPVEVFHALDLSLARWTVMHSADDLTRYYAGFTTVALHRKDSEALRLNLMLNTPEIYVALAPQTDEPGFPWKLKGVTASSYDAQDWLDGDSLLVEKLPMPDPVAAFIQAFVEHHHIDMPFKKRKRDRLDIEEQKFGKHPVFTPLTRQ